MNRRRTSKQMPEALMLASGHTGLQMGFNHITDQGSDHNNRVLPPERLRYLAERIHPLGPRPLFELFRELARGAPLAPSLERYARLHPLKDFIADLGGSELPQLRVVGGKR
jgi:hypothetical protein